MASYKQGFRQSTKERRYRRFSDTFKQKQVKSIESGISTVRQVCRAYEVSDTAVYKWLEKYSTSSKPERTIVESKSDTQKILALQKKVAELERLLGQKEVLVTYTEKLIEIAEQKYDIEIKKKPDTTH